MGLKKKFSLSMNLKSFFIFIKNLNYSSSFPSSFVLGKNQAQYIGIHCANKCVETTLKSTVITDVAKHIIWFNLFFASLSTTLVYDVSWKSKCVFAIGEGESKHIKSTEQCKGKTVK